MIYLILSFLILLVAVYILFIRCANQFKWMAKGIRMIRYGIYLRLQTRYIEEYGTDEAGFLAAAVTNELMSDSPASPEAKEYCSGNSRIIEQELRKIPFDAEISRAASQALFMKSRLAWATAADVDTRAELLLALDKLQKMGIEISRKAVLPIIFYLRAADFLGGNPKTANRKDN